MRIGIIGAMDEELEILLKEMESEKTVVKANMSFKSGRLYNKDVVVVRSGIGKVNSAICAQILIDDFDVDKIINVGIAGGIGKDVYPGDIVIADSLVQHDIDTSAFGDEIGQIPRLDTYDFKCDKNLVEKAISACENIKDIKNFVGRIVTGDQFICNTDKIIWLNEKFNGIACEMEGGSIAQVCYLNNIAFVVIRSISDNGNNGAHMDYEKFKPIAIKNSTEILKNMLINI
ncbi:5'-methylthioadenosine/adenosylhomocysteine nucleosidase [Clostridiaceae bacterium UIB06]|uniref:5'-methylthioadenosine/adenosylhomocysteine nucleosidase n=1 Tax=Clostridium thailandense TaxID=2794346 RepID=A0A949X543_9CLOT|nr:5'-methylthioadenosine/adenosylhomocysteine nucleosidase [Clostridium thailandense]MBV7275028.1 5'-methylthioadenosine/adenosylhomocysteine nucleosidase [Clostridium thailandense]MCH5136542.1 5'-methylthioadenosine/adenosylhomocysteine nucleosidase [Clostridiaceae bacterium UIB06]